MSERSPIILPLDAFAERVSVEALPVIEAATVPILRFDSEKPRIDRTAVFIHIEDEHFLLTCAHHLERRLNESVPLAVSLGYCEEPFVLLKDEVFYGTESNARDVTAIRLAPETIKRLLDASRVPVEVADVLRGEPRPGLFLIFGHPQEWFSFGPGELTHPALPYLATIVRPSDDLVARLESDEEYGMPFRSELHGLFTMSSQGIRVRDRVSVPLPTYKGMKGISGCGIWRLCDDNYEAMRNWNVAQCRLAAIEHRYDESNKFVHASWIGLALSRIVDDFPHLAPAILGSK
jgi:hypothetical protein